MQRVAIRSYGRGAVALAGLVLASIGWANSDITVVGTGGGGKLTFSLAGLSLDGSTEAPSLRQTLSRDLERSGWFQVGGPQSAIDIRGTAKGGASVLLEIVASNRATGKSYMSRAFTGAPESALLVAHRAADALVEAITGKPGIASSRIVMVGARGRSKDLFMCHPDGSLMMQITRDGKPCLSPAWSPDGKAIVYTSLLTGYADVYRIDLGTSKRSVLVNYPGMNAGAAFSPDGQQLALTLSKDGNPDLYVKDLRSGGLTRLTRSLHAAEASPSWSPDGRQIVYVSDRSRSPQLYTVSRRGGRSHVLTLRGRENTSPDWGEAGIAYSTKMGGRNGICVMDPRSKREVWRYSEPGVDFENPCWAPDGRHLACVRTQRYRSEVYLLDTEGDAPIRLTNMQGDWYSPVWSPR